MTFAERNTNILNALAQMQVIHDKYTSSSKIMTDDEWDSYFKSMSKVPEQFRGTNLEEFIYNLVVCFQTDTEDVQRRLKNVKKD